MALADELVDVASVGAHLTPPDTETIHYAGTSAGGDLRPAVAVASVTEHPYRLAMGQPACSGILRVHLQQRFQLDVSQADDINEG